MSGIISPFQMESNKVVKFKISQKDVNEEFESLIVELAVDYKISNVLEEESKLIAKLDLLIELAGITDNNQNVFEIQLDMQGIFSGDTNLIEKDKFLEMLKINGVSTIMQLSRAYVTSASALSGFAKPINFPMVNVFELNKTKEENIDSDTEKQ